MTKKINRTVLTRQEIEVGEKRARAKVGRRKHKGYEDYLEDLKGRKTKTAGE